MFEDFDVFEDYRQVIWQNAPQLQFVWCFLMIRLKLSLYSRNITEVMPCSSHFHLSGGTWFQFDLLLMMFTCIAWLKWCRPGFSGACSLPLPWLTSGHHPLTPDFVLCVPFGELGWSVARSALPPLTLEPRWPWDHIGCNFSVYFWTGKTPSSVRSGFSRAA